MFEQINKAEGKLIIMIIIWFLLYWTSNKSIKFDTRIWTLMAIFSRGYSNSNWNREINYVGFQVEKDWGNLYGWLGKLEYVETKIPINLENQTSYNIDLELLSKSAQFSCHSTYQLEQKKEGIPISTLSQSHQRTRNWTKIKFTVIVIIVFKLEIRRSREKNGSTQKSIIIPSIKKVFLLFANVFLRHY